MKGSENGPVIEAGDAENSLLILKLKGEADGDRELRAATHGASARSVSSRMSSATGTPIGTRTPLASAVIVRATLIAVDSSESLRPIQNTQCQPSTSNPSKVPRWR